MMNFAKFPGSNVEYPDEMTFHVNGPGIWAKSTRDLQERSLCEITCGNDFSHVEVRTRRRVDAPNAMSLNSGYKPISSAEKVVTWG
jgi:hypothetical protein